MTSTIVPADHRLAEWTNHVATLREAGPRRADILGPLFVAFDELHDLAVRVEAAALAIEGLEFVDAASDDREFVLAEGRALLGEVAALAEMAEVQALRCVSLAANADAVRYAARGLVDSITVVADLRWAVHSAEVVQILNDARAER